MNCEMPVTEGIQDLFMVFEFVVTICLAFFVFGLASEINYAVLGLPQALAVLQPMSIKHQSFRVQLWPINDCEL